MSPFTALMLGLAIGGGIGHCGTWIFLMNKYAGRPVGWQTIISTFSVTLALLGLFFGGR